MKTLTIILATMFTLNVSLLFAENESVLRTPSTETATINLQALSPVTPLEATFEDTPATIDPASFAPVTPGEADFAEPLQPVIDEQALAPSVPAEADFE